MLIPDEIQELLTASGVIVGAEHTDHGDAGFDLVLHFPGAPESDQRLLVLEVQRYARPTSARQLKDVAGRRRASREGEHPRAGLLVITPSASEEAFSVAIREGISLIAVKGNGGPRGHLVLGNGNVMPLRSPPSGGVVPRPYRRNPGWGRLQIIRTLLLREGCSQIEIARWSGVSQPRVSQVLRTLTEAGLLRVDLTSIGAGEGHRPGLRRRSWAIQDRQRLLRHWLESYPGPGGVATYWYGLQPPAEQVRAAHAVLCPAAEGSPLTEGGQRCLVSGGVAADLIAPWVRPRSATLYARRGADLSVAGLTPTAGADATLTLIVPQDPGVWALADEVWRAASLDPAPGGIPLADPLQVLYDLGRSSSTDVDQAIDRLLRRWAELRAVVDQRSPTTSPASGPVSRSAEETS